MSTTNRPDPLLAPIAESLTELGVPVEAPSLVGERNAEDSARIAALRSLHTYCVEWVAAQLRGIDVARHYWPIVNGYGSTLARRYMCPEERVGVLRSLESLARDIVRGGFFPFDLWQAVQELVAIDHRLTERDDARTLMTAGPIGAILRRAARAAQSLDDREGVRMAWGAACIAYETSIHASWDDDADITEVA